MKKLFGCLRGILILPFGFLGVLLYAMFVLPFILVRAVFCLVGLC
jgi:hypothetical protein